MPKSTFACLAMCALAAMSGRAAGPEPPAGAKAELARLKGTWVVTRMVWRKQDRKASGMTYSFDGEKLTRSSPYPGGGKEERTFQATFDVMLDTAKKLLRMDLVPDARFKGTVGASRLVCIYKIEKGELHLAVGMGGKAPADFSGNESAVFVMKKEKMQE